MASEPKPPRADARRLAPGLDSRLTVVHGDGEYLLGEFDPAPAADPLRGALGEIRGAAECAAGLTRKLIDLPAPGDGPPGTPSGRR